MIYLFSPQGRKDLKRIVQYHIGTKTLYSTDVMEKKKIRVRTLLHDQEIEITAWERESGRRGRRDVDVEKKRKEEDPSNWVFSINKGEATVVKTCADFFAENGVIQPINSVLIPSDVELPYGIGM